MNYKIYKFCGIKLLVYIFTFSVEHLEYVQKITINAKSIILQFRLEFKQKRH